MMQLFTELAGIQVIGASAITWTPVTFYVAMGIVHTIAILVGFRILQVEAEHNSFVGAIMAAVIINVIAYFVRDTGVVGVMITGASVFGMLVLVSSGEALKAAMMCFIVFASYALVGNFVVSRTPLNMDDIAGLARVINTGGLQAEPITEDDHKRLEQSGVAPVD